MSRQATVLSADAIEAMEETSVAHPLNPRSGISFRSLGDAAGLERTGFHLSRLGPGKEANELHTHHFEEEFYYVLEGRGVLLIGDESHEMGPGSFAAFPAPSVPHMMTNPHEEDLVYLTGGERREFELAEFPRHDKVLIRAGSDFWIVDADAMARPEFEIEGPEG